MFGIEIYTKNDNNINELLQPILNREILDDYSIISKTMVEFIKLLENYPIKQISE